MGFTMKHLKVIVDLSHIETSITNQRYKEWLMEIAVKCFKERMDVIKQHQSVLSQLDWYIPQLKHANTFFKMETHHYFNSVLLAIGDNLFDIYLSIHIFHDCNYFRTIGNDVLVIDITYDIESSNCNKISFNGAINV